MKNQKKHRSSSGDGHRRWCECGVSEVIGVVLLLALVVVGGTIVGTQLLSQPAPKNIPSVNFLANYEPGTLTLYHTGGDTLPNGDYKFVVQYEDGRTENFTRPDWSSGKSLTYPAVSQPGKVTLIYTGNGVGETALRSVVIGGSGLDGAGSSSTGTGPNETPTATVTATATATATPTVTATATTTPTATPSSPQTYTINVNASLGGSITANTNSGIITILAGTNNNLVTVNYGEQPTFTFTPDAISHIAGVTINGTAKGAITTYTFQPVTDNSNTVDARFAINTYTIDVTASQGGSITATTTNGTITIPAGTNNKLVTVNYGEQPIFTFTPDAISHIAGVTINGTAKGAITTYTFQPVTDNSNSVAATFVINTYTINVTASMGGNITANTSSGTVTIPPGTTNQQVTVNYNEQPTFTFTPDIGSHTVDVVINGVSKGPAATYTLSPVTDNSNTVSATFAANIYDVNVTSGRNGSVTANEQIIMGGTTGTVKVGYNGQVNLSYAPATGFHIGTVNYSADDGSLMQLPIVDNASTLTGVKSNYTVIANFAINTYAITVTQPTHGTVTPNGTVTVDYGSTPTFTFTPDTGYHLNNVTVDGSPVTTTGNTYTFPPVTGPHTLEATFAIDTFTINATVGNHGTINPNGSITVNYGEQPAFTITADTGYHITSVTVDSTLLTVPAGNTSYPYTFPPVTASHTINASFAINTYTINATAGQHGTISPNGTVPANYGDSRTFTITPDAGYKIADVTVDGVSQGAIATYALNNIQSDHTITASFTQITYSINAYTDVKLGSISPSGSLTYNYHDTPSFTITPVTGYHITNLLVDGVSLGPDATYTFAALEDNHTITANFAIDTFTITATAGEGGSISPQGIVPANYGDSKTFTITPNSGSEIDTIFVDGIAVGETDKFTFTQINGNHTINVLFDVGGNGPYSIEGTFWNDLNGDGKHQSGEPPLEGWTVKVDIYHGQNSPLTRTLITDKNGYYKFDKLPKGHYYVSQVAKSGWDQTYPWQHGGRDIDNLNPGRSDKHQHVTDVDFMNHLINGTYIPGTDFHLQASRPGYIEQGGFISFNITNTWSWVDMKSSGGTTTRYPLNVGDKAKIVIKSNSSGKIDAQFPQITTFEFPNADLFINDNLITTGAVPAIYVSMYDTYTSTLTLKVPAPDQQLFSTFQVNGMNVFPDAWPTNHNKWEYVIYNLKPSSSGQFHLNTQPPNAERETGLGEYYGGGDGYQMY